MNKIELAYCAGVVDSDGCITIKKRKVAEGKYSHSASVFVRQVEDGAVTLLHRLFKGSIRIRPPSTPGGRDLNHWAVSCRQAMLVARTLLPYLRIKHKQAKILLRFDEMMKNHRLRRTQHWFVLKKSDRFYSVDEAAAAKGIDRSLIYQAIHNKSVFSVKNGRRRLIPKRFWDAYIWKKRGRQPLPIEYLKIRDDITLEIRSLNGPTRGIQTMQRLRK